MMKSVDGELNAEMQQSNTVVSEQGARYVLKDVMACGGYGVIFRAAGPDGNKVAIKMQCYESSMQEIGVLKAVTNCIHFCRLYDQGVDFETHFIVMEMVGLSLANLKAQLPNKRFSRGTALRLSMQCLHAIEELHRAGFISRDIKPGNFAVGLPGAKQRLIRMVDFGVAKKYVADDGRVIQPAAWVGTARYCSLANHKGKQQCRRDDIESWFYMCIEMLTSSLPWAQLNRCERQAIGEMKVKARHIHRRRFLYSCPKIFDLMLEIIDDWKYTTEPDYDGILISLADLLKREYVEFDDPYDWETFSDYQLHG